MTSLNRYDTEKPPRLVELWLDMAPIVSMIIAALTFIIGLNLFVYLSSQVRTLTVHVLGNSPLIYIKQARYVSLSTNALTVLNSLCLLVVVIWFTIRSKHATQAMVNSHHRSNVSPSLVWVKRLCRSTRIRHFQRNVYW